MQNAIKILKSYILIAEKNCVPSTSSIGEPKLDIHGIYPKHNTKETKKNKRSNEFLSLL